MSLHQRKLKLIEFDLDGVNFECQVQTWNLDPGIEDGDRLYSYCPDGEAIEETDPEPTLELTFYSDWRSAGISDFLWTNYGQVATFKIDHHPDIPAEHVSWTGSVVLKPGPVGGEIRSTEMTEVTLQCVGMPTYAREV